LQLPGADPHGPLGRGLAKLEAALATRANVAIAVDRPPFLDAVQTAVEEQRQLAVTYYVASRDELTERIIEPQLTFLDRGRWYVVADDVANAALRTFRIDRLEAVTSTGARFAHRSVAPPTESGWFADTTEARFVTLRLQPAAGW